VTTDPGGGVAVEIERARALCDLGRFDDAAPLLQRAVALEPQNADAWCLLAQAQLGRHNDEDALQAAGTALSLAPDDEWPHRLFSVALQRLGRNEESLLAAREATRVAPYAWPAFVRLAHAALADGHRSRHDEALAAAEQAVALAPHEAEPHITVGMVARARKRYKEAEAAFRTALAIDPQHSAAHNELARLHLRKNRFAGAASLAEAAGGFTNAVRADPGADVSRRNLDLVIRVFLARVAYLIFLDAYLAIHGLSGSANTSVRLLPIVLLAVPARFAWRFVRRLSPDLRRHLRHLLLGRALRIPTGLEAVAVVLLLVAVVAPPHARPAAAGIAVVMALVARLYLRVYTDHSARAATGARLVTTRALWLIAVGLALVTLILFASAAGAGFAAGQVLAGCACAAGCVGALYAIRRRSPKAATSRQEN
jgi:Flp pilus assembly protein TadD